MDFQQIVQSDWAKTLEVNDKGIWTIQGGACAIGIVLFVTCDRSVVLVRKARKPGYEFSGKLTLPGGNVRTTGATHFVKDVVTSLHGRVRAECGLDPDSLTGVQLEDISFAPVTTYTSTSGGARRCALVLCARASASFANLAPDDPSVEAAFWQRAPYPWQELAPANRLHIARAVSTEMSDGEKNAQLHWIEDALTFCNDAAVKLGLPPAKHPWAPG